MSQSALLFKSQILVNVMFVHNEVSHSFPKRMKLLLVNFFISYLLLLIKLWIAKR